MWIAIGGGVEHAMPGWILRTKTIGRELAEQAVEGLTIHLTPDFAPYKAPATLA